MPITPTTPTAGVDLLSLSNALRQSSPARDSAERVDPTIAECYGRLVNKKPVYEDMQGDSVFGTPKERDIQDQLGALLDKMKFLMQREDCASASANAAHLDAFHDKLTKRGQDGGLSNEEAHYFYSKPFKGLLERHIADIDRAMPEDRERARQRLDALCSLLNDPTSMFKQVVVKTIIDEFVKAFGANLQAGQPG